MNDSAHDLSGAQNLDDAIQIEDELGALITEFDRNTLARPPSEEALQRWELRAESLAQQLDLAVVPGKHRLLRHLDRFRARLADMHVARERYLARRQRARSFDRLENLTWVESPAVQPRQLLAAAIHQQLESNQYTRLLPTGTDESASSPTSTPSSPISESVVEAAPAPLEEDAPAADVVASRPPRLALSVGLLEPNERRALYQRHSTRLDPIIAIEGRLARAGSFVEARDIALDWLHKKGFRPPVSSPDSFEIEVPGKGHRAMAVGLPGVWALQAETADNRLQGRRWRVEMVLVDAAPTPAIAVTLTALSPANEPPPAPSIPGLVSTLIAQVGLLDIEAGEVLNAGPSLVQDHAALHALVESLQSPRRSRPAIVLSTYNKGESQATLLDPVGLARKLGGLAKVYVLTREMTWALTDALNRRFAVAGATVRMFRPGFTPDDESGRHPSWSPNELTAQGMNLHGLSTLFLREAAYASLRALEREDAIPAFERVREQVLRRQIQDARRKALPAITQTQPSADLVAIERALHDAEELGRLFEADNNKLRHDLQRVRDERDTLTARIYFLESRLEDLQATVREQQGGLSPEFPVDWDALEEWCERHLGERVVVTNKAIRAARDSDYLNIPFAYEILWFMAETYVPCKQGRLQGGVDLMNAEMGRLGIEISAVGRASTERRSKETYSTNYKRERVPLDMHVKGSSDRDPRFAFRVYFHWHVQDQRAVVGWFPGHLDNAMT